MRLHPESSEPMSWRGHARAVWRWRPRTALSLIVNRPRWWTHIYPEALAAADVT